MFVNFFGVYVIGWQKKDKVKSYLQQQKDERCGKP